MEEKSGGQIIGDSGPMDELDKWISEFGQADKLVTYADEKSLAWDILIRKLDYQTQMKISQQSHHLEEVVRLNAESELRKFQRHIREDKYMLVVCNEYRITYTV